MIDDATMERARADAMRLAARFTAERIRLAALDRWQFLVDDWAAIEAVFDALRDALRARGDLSRGVLRSLGWKPSMRMRDLLAGLPALENLVRLLGRLRESDDPDAPDVLERIVGPIRRTIEREIEHKAEGSVELRGVERSDEISRMLQSEAALLARPKLRRLWFARFAERALITYHAEGVYSTRIQTAQGFDDGIDQSNRRAERGPILVVLDTSGSMSGMRERIAKALVLQVLCCAHAEERPCYVYNFSGPGDVDEHEIGFDGDALAAALLFLSKSYGGGTDPREPMRLALRRLGDERWKFADVLVVSDGDFYGIDPAMVSAVERAKREHGTRFHGVVIGAESTPEIDAICDPVHVVTKWLALCEDLRAVGTKSTPS